MKYQDESTYVQCTDCGNIFRVKGKLNVDILYTKKYCPCCGQMHTVLNVGKDILDKYLFYNSTLDERFFIYN